MMKKLIKHGNSLALVIEKPVLDLLGAGPETSFDIITDGHALVLVPIKGSRKNKFTFWRERRMGRCKAPRRRRCGDIVEERQRRRCPSAAAPRRAAGFQNRKFLWLFLA
jgi:antitoxin component of MazEF toxin-antitoxin module